LSATVRLRLTAAAPAELIACGVGCGGPIDPATRTVSPLYVPSWSHFPLVAELEELLQLPVFVDTDARALALAEAWCGGAVGIRDFIGVVMGLLAGFYRGWVDTLLSRTVDVVLSIPILLLGLALIESLGLYALVIAFQIINKLK
jgi:peptide/nickel transport system permease protein